MPRLLADLRLLAHIAGMEWRNARGRHHPRLLADGFFSDRAGLYPFDRFPRALFLNDWEIETRLGRINPPEARAPLADKLLFHLLVERLALPVRLPVLAGLANGGAFVPVDPFASWEEAARAPLIAKPVSGSGGRGVLRLEPGAAIPPGTNLIERAVKPHPYAAAIFPGALNTVRVMTARDPDTGAPFVLGAAHRFGTPASAPTDNRKQGGIFSAVDLTTGILSAAVGLGPGNRREVHAAHPETGARIEGVAVPCWNRLLADALMLARTFHDLAFVGWDLALDKEGPVVIEGNASLPNPNLLQAHAPLLLDPRARRFFSHHGVISARRAARARRAAAPAAAPAAARS